VYHHRQRLDNIAYRIETMANCGWRGRRTLAAKAGARRESAGAVKISWRQQHTAGLLLLGGTWRAAHAGISWHKAAWRQHGTATIKA